MKDYQRPVLTLKCSGTGATVLSSVVACQAPKSHPLMCHKEEANICTTGEEQGLSSSRKTWEVPAWAFRWGALLQTEMTLCWSSNVYGFCQGQSVPLSDSAVRSPLLWAESGQPADPGSH